MVEVIRAGIQSSFQDLGRYGYRDQGVPLSGAMDQYASRLANQLLGNAADTALIEFVMQGPKLRFDTSKHVALTGGVWDVELNGEPVPMSQIIEVPQAGVLDIKGARRGMYGYLAVLGGWKRENVLGSCSFYPPINPSAKLHKGDQLSLNSSHTNHENQHASVAPESSVFEAKVLEVLPGPEFDMLSADQRESIFETDFSITKESNRMAASLEQHLKLQATEITTGPVQPGTVQLTPSGRVVVLMRDAQTTGGYARILQLGAMAINQLAQKRAGEKFRFHVSLPSAKANGNGELKFP